MTRQHLSKAVSNRLANFSLTCSILVVFIHAEPERSPGTAVWWVYNLIGGGLSLIAVPFFFFKSGFLLAGHREEEGWYGREVVKRIRSIVLPFVVCSVLWFLVSVGLFASANLLAHRPLLFNVDLSFHRFVVLFGLDPLLRPEYGILWFFRTLFLLILASPLLMRLANVGGLLLLLILYGTVCPATSVVDGTWRVIFRFLISLEGVFYFTCGMFARKYQDRIRLPQPVIWGCLVAGMVLMIFGLSLPSVYLRWLGIPFLMVGLGGACPSSDWKPSLTGLSMPIYILHAYMLALIGRVIVHPCPALVAFLDTWYGYLVWGAFISGCSVLVGICLRRFCPTVAKLMFGGR